MKPFLPPWLEGPPPPGSWRALFRWGDPDQARHPGPRLVRMLQEAFELSDEEFRKPRRTGLEPAAGIPGTVGGAAPSFIDAVALAPFASADFDGAILTSNAFGGAHAAMLLTHD